MTRRGRTPLVFALFGLGAAGLVAAVLHAAVLAGPARARMSASADLVARVGLTDLALFTEARYTRNPALADLHTPFQDNPMSFEHFPSGSFAPRPAAGFGRGALGFDAVEVAR